MTGLEVSSHEAISYFSPQPAEAKRWEALTFPPYRDLLSGGRVDGLETVAAGDGDAAVGLAMARIDAREPRVAEVLSLAVAASHRGRGVGSELLARLERALSARGCRRATGVYATPTASTEALERLLRRRGWARSQPRMVLFLSTTERIRRAPWVWRSLPPADVEIVGWDEVGKVERAELRASLGELAVPTELDPFAEPEIEVPGVSVALRHEGRIVGWMITHRVFPDTIRYSRLFVTEALRRRGLGLALVAAALRRHLSSPLDHEAPYGRWTFRFDNPRMVEQLRRGLEPYLVSTTITKGTYKLLSALEESA